GAFNLTLPAIDAGDRAGDLSARSQPLLDEDGCKLLRRFAGIDRGGHLAKVSHAVPTSEGLLRSGRPGACRKARRLGAALAVFDRNNAGAPAALEPDRETVPGRVRGDVDNVRKALGVRGSLRCLAGERIGGLPTVSRRKLTPDCHGFGLLSAVRSKLIGRHQAFLARQLGIRFVRPAGSGTDQ